MPTDHRRRLREIRTFPQLVAYLRDEMEWPIGSEDFEELTFEYTPEELGIDPKNAAKIQEIKRLRPLSIHQPWGIFFVKFEPKRLPVGALRRILGQVAIKKRGSANSDERAAWSADDLLFVSNYGEGDDRQITFAHFSQNEEKKDLPTLKVLDWDNLDTALHIDDAVELLTTKLRWPDNEEDAEVWGSQWRSAFTRAHREVIDTSKKLSMELAVLARNIRDRINTVLTIETEDGPVSKLMAAFKEALVHDLDEDGFADMYAQTIAYGLLSARVANPAGGTADDVAAAMPVTNPFLKELMEAFLHVGGRKGRASHGLHLDFDELGVSEVVDLLDASNMEAVVRDFGDRNPQEDPVIHFYELFLKEYDGKKRMQRGVFYTPRPVVSFIVRSVDEVLRTEFGLEDGLADTTTWRDMARRIDDLAIPDGATPDQAFVQILDPATGTGTFLVEVIGLIHKTMTEKWRAQGDGAKKIEHLWNDYVSKHLLPRLHGYELLMAPYAIAHMKIGLKLYETGYRFESDTRVRVYLTNSLEPPQDFSGTFAFAIPALAHEAEEVTAIKRHQRFTVVIGNPPYSGKSSNRGSWIETLIDDYRMVDGKPLGEVKVWLKDDYVKFIRLGEHCISESGIGILGYISNNSFFDGLTFRGMRHHLLSSFDRGSFLNLHGNGNLKERCPDGSPDENVFDILQGVGISVLAKSRRAQGGCVLNVGDLFGTREVKYERLSLYPAVPTTYAQIIPKAPYFFFVFRDDTGTEEYERFTSVKDLFEIGGLGFQSHRDSFVVAMSDNELKDRMKVFFDLDLSDDEVADRLGIRNYRRFQIGAYRRKNRMNVDVIRKIQYRPFDYRAVYYAPDIVQEWQIRFHGHLLKANLGLNVMRQTKAREWRHVMVSDTPTPAVFVEIKDGSSQFPLFRYTEFDDSLFASNAVRIPNLDDHIVQSWCSRLGVRANWMDENAMMDELIAPEDVFHYAYAVLHSPSFRERYFAFLAIEFPRLPLTDNLELFRSLCKCGSDLVALHLADSPTLDAHITSLAGAGDYRVEKVSYSKETVWIDEARTRGFRGVPEEVWNFHIGGYQVCEKWLKDRQAKGGKNPRPGRLLTDEDIEHYQKIVVALSETIRTMGEIDDVIEQHGGWPGAFQTGKTEASYAQGSVQPRKVAEKLADYDATKGNTDK